MTIFYVTCPDCKAAVKAGLMAALKSDLDKTQSDSFVVNKRKKPKCTDEFLLGMLAVRYPNLAKELAV
jgi:hypothetical protein